jgi:tRNA(Ile)-lysidine synthase
MFKLQGHIPRKVAVACSGGVDSMTIADFLSNNHDVTLLYFNHGTTTGDAAQAFLEQHAQEKNLKLHIGEINDPRAPKGKSTEEHWRIERYKWLDEQAKKLNTEIVTGHHLDDCVETWIWSSLHGTSKIVPYRRKQVIRPFRLNTKDKFYTWAEKYSIDFIEDLSNTNTKYMRNYVRHELMPHALKVNPGLHNKVVRKKVLTDVGHE